MITLAPITPYELNETDLRRLVRGAARTYDGLTPVHVVKLVLEDKAALFRISGDIEGLCVLQKTVREAGAECWILATAAKGLFSHFEEFLDAVKDIAAGWNAVTVASLTSLPGAVRMLDKKLNLKPVAYMFRVPVLESPK